jgi:hypothetical protein
MAKNPDVIIRERERQHANRQMWQYQQTEMPHTQGSRKEGKYKS